MRISIIVPAHNEEENLVNLASKLIPTLEKHEETRNYEVIIVNDNSKDNTPFIIEDLAKANSRIKPVHRNDTPGFGNAIKTGFKYASGDIIVPVMGDLSDDPEDIPKLIRKIEEGFDIAYGSRFISGGSLNDYPFAKKIANRAFNNSVRLLFGIRNKDVTNAFKAYKKEVLDAIGIENIDAEGFDLTVELPLKAYILGFKSAEVPVNWYGREKGEAKLKLSRNGSIYGKRLLKLFLWGNFISLRDMFRYISRLSWKSAAFALFLGIIILLSVFKFSGFDQVYDILKTASPYWIALCGSSILITFLLRTWRWNVLLKSAGYVFPNDMLFKCIMFSWLLNYLVPARLGDIARGAALKTTEGAPLSVSLSTVVVERIYDTMTLAFLLAIASLFFYKEQLFWLELFSIAIFIGLLSVLFIIYKKDCYIIMALGTRIPSLKESMYLMKDGLNKIMKNKSAMALCFAVSIPVWLFEISSIFFASKAIDFDISFLFATVSGIAAFIAQSLPVTPAGIGVHEASITGILALFGVPTSTGMSIALIDHFARGFIIYTFGLISAIHIGFASRSYFKQTKDNKMTGDKVV